MRSALLPLLCLAALSTSFVLQAADKAPVPNPRNELIIRNESSISYTVRLGGGVTNGAQKGETLKNGMAATILDKQTSSLATTGGEQVVAPGKTLTIQFPDNLPMEGTLFKSRPEGCAFYFTLKLGKDHQHYTAIRKSKGSLIAAAEASTVVDESLTPTIAGNVVTLKKAFLHN